MKKETTKPRGRFVLKELGYIGNKVVHPSQALTNRAKAYLKKKGLRTPWEIPTEDRTPVPVHLRGGAKTDTAVLDCSVEDDNLVVTAGGSAMAHILAGE